jgi:hypothetical protein
MRTRSFTLLFCLSLFLFQTVIASPLVFKTTKTSTSPDKFEEFFTLDTSKYRQLRIHIVSSDPTGFNWVVRAVEGDDELAISARTVNLEFADNFILENPPTKIRVSVRGKGTFKAFVWAQ